jgi:ADP-ribosylglycohydrolase
MKTASHSAQADRAAGAIVGAFIGDALGVGPHWYYDLDEMRNAFKPWIDGYTAPKPGRYHDGLQPGDLSQTGLIMEILLRSTMDRGGYDEQDFCRRLDEDFLPQLDGAPHHGPGGYTNHSFRQVWQNRVQERQPWGHTGGNADTSEAAERLTILSARYASDPGHLAHFALGNCELSQNDSLVAQQSVAFALVLAALIRGEPFDEELSGKLMDLVGSGEVSFVAKSSIAAGVNSEDTLGFASPDALLLPSWIAKAARDPAIRIEPAWKVSLVYGMSCAINFVLPAAYYLAARFPSDFETPVLHALNGGGQNMSRACLTGALAGAQVGLSGIPKRLIKGLKRSEQLVAAANKVARDGVETAGAFKPAAEARDVHVS